MSAPLTNNFNEIHTSCSKHGAVNGVIVWSGYCSQKQTHDHTRSIQDAVIADTTEFIGKSLCISHSLQLVDHLLHLDSCSTVYLDYLQDLQVPTEYPANVDQML